MFEEHRWSVLKDVCDKVEKVPGDVIVCGVGEGGLVGWLADRFPDRNVWGYCRFDEGLEKPSSVDSDTLHEGTCAARYDMVRSRYSDHRIKLVKGNVQDTFFTPHNTVALAILDLNLYEPTRHCLEVLLRILHRDGRILVDDWDWTGVNAAIVEVPFPRAEKRGYLMEIWK